MYGNIPNALASLFPDIGIDKNKFLMLKVPRNYKIVSICLFLLIFSILARYWKKPENRRKFFVDYANKNNFDPLVPSNWYSIKVDDVSAEKVLVPFISSINSFIKIELQGGSSALMYHNNSVVTALAQLFPNIGLDKSKFDTMSRK